MKHFLLSLFFTWTFLELLITFLIFQMDFPIIINYFSYFFEWTFQELSAKKNRWKIDLLASWGKLVG
jgi:hypothetical protein